MPRVLVLLSVLVVCSGCGPSEPDRADVEAVVGAELSESQRLGGLFDSWRVRLSHTLPQPFSEPADGDYWWVYSFAADSTYEPPPSSPLRCRWGAKADWGPSSPMLCEGEQAPWQYVAEVWPETGRGRFIAALPAD